MSWVLNPKTDHISPQFHVIFDDKFTSVKPTTETEYIKIWKGLSRTNKLQADLSYDLELDDITWKANNYKKKPSEHLK